MGYTREENEEADRLIDNMIFNEDYDSITFIIDINSDDYNKLTKN